MEYLHRGYKVYFTKSGKVGHLVKGSFPLCGKKTNPLTVRARKSELFPKVRTKYSKSLCTKCKVLAKAEEIDREQKRQKVVSSSSDESESDSDSEESDSESDSESETSSSESDTESCSENDDTISDESNTMIEPGERCIVKVLKKGDLQEVTSVYSFLIRLYKLAMDDAYHLECEDYPTKSCLSHGIQLVSWMMKVDPIEYSFLPKRKIQSKLEKIDGMCSLRSRPEIEKKSRGYYEDIDEFSQEGKLIVTFLVNCCEWVLRTDKVKNKPPDLCFSTRSAIKNMTIPLMPPHASAIYKKTYNLLLSYRRVYEGHPENVYLEGRIEGLESQLKVLTITCPSYSSVLRNQKS